MVFPAYAGMIPPARGAGILVPGVPRIRGDDPAVWLFECESRLCSPHTRG